MIIWTGKGFLIAIFVFGCSLAANLITNGTTGGEVYWESHKWPLGIAMLVAAAISWPVGQYLANKDGRTLVDKATGEEVLVGGDHSLFFIKVRWWGPILCVLGAGIIIVDLAQS